MEKDTKIVLSAVLLLLFTMVSFSFFDVTNDDNFITGNADLIQYRPDLIVEDAYFYDYNTNQIITTPSVGDILGVKVIVKNRGGTSAIYTSNSVNSYPAIMFDGQITKDGVGKLSLNHWISNLNSGETFTIETSSQPDLLKEGGLYCFNLNIDSYNNVAESDENNNLFTKCIQVGQVVQNPNPPPPPALPDLIISKTEFSVNGRVVSSSATSQNLDVIVYTKNIGTAAANNYYYSYFDPASNPLTNLKNKAILTKDGAYYSEQIAIVGYPDLISPNQEVSRWIFDFSSYHNNLLTPGRYCISEVTADIYDVITESNEQNNVLTNGQCINIITAPDLIVDDIKLVDSNGNTITTAAVYSQQFLSITLKNIGSGIANLFPNTPDNITNTLALELFVDNDNKTVPAIRSSPEYTRGGRRCYFNGCPDFNPDFNLLESTLLPGQTSAPVLKPFTFSYGPGLYCFRRIFGSNINPPGLWGQLYTGNTVADSYFKLVESKEYNNEIPNSNVQIFCVTVS